MSANGSSFVICSRISRNPLALQRFAMEIPLPDKPPASSDTTSLGQRAAGGLFAAHDQAWKPVAKTMLKDAAPVPRYVLRNIPGVPGLIYDAATFATADD